VTCESFLGTAAEQKREFERIMRIGARPEAAEFLRGLRAGAAGERGIRQPPPAAWTAEERYKARIDTVREQLKATGLYSDEELYVMEHLFRGGTPLDVMSWLNRGQLAGKGEAIQLSAASRARLMAYRPWVDTERTLQELLNAFMAQWAANPEAIRATPGGAPVIFNVHQENVNTKYAAEPTPFGQPVAPLPGIDGGGVE
jgi:hypothetical protein